MLVKSKQELLAGSDMSQEHASGDGENTGCGNAPVNVNCTLLEKRGGDDLFPRGSARKGRSQGSGLEGSK